MKNDFEYDIAISLCKQDVEFARKLKAALNPKLNIFFYEDCQEQIVAKMGPVEFGKVFRELSRVVVILHREDWGNSYYTELERNCIVDRTIEGHQFIFLIPLEKKSAPPWFPRAMIYGDPTVHSVERLASFIELKVTERGGEITPLTFAEKMDHFSERLENKRKLNQYLQSKDSVLAAQEEIILLATHFNKFIEEFTYTPSGISRSTQKISITNNLFPVCGIFGLRSYWLDFYIAEERGVSPLTSSQTYQLYIRLLENRPTNPEYLCEQAFYTFNTDLSLRKGWSEINPVEQQNVPRDDRADLILRRPGGGIYYELGNIISSGNLLEKWLHRLFFHLEYEYESILK